MMRLGDLVVAVFDEAARHGSNPEEVSRQAMQVLMHVLQGTRTTIKPLDQRSASTRPSHPRIPALS